MKNKDLARLFAGTQIMSASLLLAQTTGRHGVNVVPQTPQNITASGEVFWDGCSAIDKPAKQLSSYETHSNVQCLSYVDGVFESMSLAHNLHLGPTGFCAPDQPVQRNELVQTVRKYIGGYPDTSNERTVILVWLARSETYTCDKTKT
jgi:hypothetical protein